MFNTIATTFAHIGSMIDMILMSKFQ